MAVVLGVDPGFSGALAWYNTTTERIVAVVPMPVRTNSGGVFDTKIRVELDVQRLCHELRVSLPSLAVVERVNASPQMGVTSAFRFGEGFGVLTGALAALDIRTVYAYPSAWKAGMGLSADKKESVKLAVRLFPEWSARFLQDKASGDLAEAALLAYYGRNLIQPSDIKPTVPADSRPLYGGRVQTPSHPSQTGNK